MEHPYKIKRSYGGSSTMGMFVSLYMILLAFFIVLQASSQTQSEDAADIVDSVQTAFGRNVDKADARNSALSLEEQIAQDDAYLAKASGLFKDRLNIEKAYEAGRGRRLEISLPLSSFFSDGSVSVQAGERALMRDIANIVDAAPAGRVREVVFLVEHAGGRSQQTLALRRSSALAAYFSGTNVASNLFSAGIAEAPSGQGSKLRIVFFSRSARDGSYQFQPWAHAGASTASRASLSASEG